MIIEFDKSFEKSLDKIRNKMVFQRINEIIIELEKSESPLAVTAPPHRGATSLFSNPGKTKCEQLEKRI